MGRSGVDNEPKTEHDWRVRVEGTDLFHADIRGQEALVSLSALPAGTPVRVTAFAP